jgi:hypothetical protein
MPVEHILRQLGGGMSEAELLADFSYLAPEDVRAALLFSADELRKPFRTALGPDGDGWADIVTQPVGMRAAE